MSEHRRSGHTVSSLKAHMVWVTKYRYPVLTGSIQSRCRELIIQICDAEDVRILKGVVSKDHIHMHIEYPPGLPVSDLVKRLKGRTSRRLQDEFPALKKRYWGRHFWAIGYGIWSQEISQMRWFKSIWSIIETCQMEIQGISYWNDEGGEDFQSSLFQPMDFQSIVVEFSRSWLKMFVAAIYRFYPVFTMGTAFSSCRV